MVTVTVTETQVITTWFRESEVCGLRIRRIWSSRTVSYRRGNVAQFG